MAHFFAYVGANPDGRSPPDLRTVPLPPGDPHGNFDAFTFVLAFANADSNGNYTPFWDPSITPDLIEQIVQSNANVGFRAALGGDERIAPWVAPSNPNAWIDNATSSLTNIIQTYHLTGIDVDYEGNGVGDPTFEPVMGQVIDNLVNVIPFQRGIGDLFSYAPFGATNPAYVSLYNNRHSEFVQINYQAYADGLGTVDEYINLYNTLLTQYNFQLQTTHPFSSLGLGIASSTTMRRGLQPPDIFTVWTQLQNMGISTAAIWDLEDSSRNGYPIEKMLYSLALRTG